MIRTKFLVLQKKIFKLKARGNSLLRQLAGAKEESRWRLQFLSNSTLPANSHSKTVRLLHVISKCLDFPAQRKANQSVFRSLFPRPIKDHRKLRNIWPTSSYDGSVPKLSRGFKGNPRNERPESRRSERRRELDLSDGEAALRRLAQEHVAEQRLFFKRSHFQRPLGTKREGSVECKDCSLPPPRRCRLSCPLPPPDFVPPDAKDFVPMNRAASVRFISAPQEFVPVPEGDALPSRYHMSKRSFSETKPKEKAESSTSKMRKKNPIDLRPPRARLVPKMKALRFDPYTLALDYAAVNAPTHIHKNEVLVQVIYSGVCRTDLYVAEGKIHCGNEPIILGHEISGKVYAVGRDVTHVQPGDKVAVNPYTACSVCRYCVRGQFSSCLTEGMNNSIGLSKNGGWAEYVVVDKSQAYNIPSTMGLDQAALIQPLSCVLSAMSKLNISTDMHVLIQGLGLAGCLWASVLHSRGYRNVYVSEKSKRKREQFQELNLGYSFIPPEDIMRFSADVVIECSGSPSAMERSLNILNPNGQMCFFRKPRPAVEIRCIPFEIVSKEIVTVGSCGNSFCFSEAVDLASFLGDRYLQFEKLGIQVFDLANYREAFRLKQQQGTGKIMFRFDD